MRLIPWGRSLSQAASFTVWGAVQEVGDLLLALMDDPGDVVANLNDGARCGFLNRVVGFLSCPGRSRL